MMRVGFNSFALAVIGKAADLWGVSAHDITAPGRNQRVFRPRAAAAWVLRQCEPRQKNARYKVYSYPRMLQIFPWTDHTTAINAVRRADKLMATEEDYAEKLSELLAFAKELRNPPKPPEEVDNGQPE